MPPSPGRRIPAPQFLVAGIKPGSRTFEILGQEAFHIARVLRKKPGEVLRLFDGKGTLFFGEIAEAKPERVAGRILKDLPSPVRASGLWPWDIHLYQALPKGSKWDWVLEKGTEMGVGRFVPLLSQRTVVRVLPAKAAKKTERWQKIVASAAQQCGLARLPVVEKPAALSDALRRASQDGGLILFAWKSEAAEPIWDVLVRIPKLGASNPAIQLRNLELEAGPMPRPIGLFIGPEGGWSPDEAQAAKEAGARLVGLGPQVLRAETASIAAIAMIHALLMMSR